VVRTGPQGEPFYEAKWRSEGSQVKRRIGRAWLDPDGAGGWARRRGRVPEGYFDEKRATVRMAELIAAQAERRSRERANRRQAVSFREVAADWLSWLEQVKRARPSTLRNYRRLLAGPGAPHARGGGKSKGRIMAAFGDRPAAEITTGEVSSFLRGLDAEGVSPRSVNQARQILSAIFNYGRREDSFGLPVNPVEGTDKRREPPAAALDFFEPEEVEELASAAAAGAHRDSSALEVGSNESAARCHDDAQDADLFRVLAYTGLRVGEALALRWGDVDIPARRLIVQRARSAGIEGPTKSWQVRYVPLADPAVEALVRLRARRDFTSRDDLVFCGRLGEPLDDSALRRRYHAARRAAGLRHIKLHGLRHGAGSLIAREMDPVFVQYFLGHAKLSTTERYMHAKARYDDVDRLNRAFGIDIERSSVK
jgi:integrase